jgi:acylphosphatase
MKDKKRGVASDAIYLALHHEVLELDLHPSPFSLYPLPFCLYPLSFPFMARTSPKLAKKFLIAGRVQGVGFRYFAERWATQLGITGYVKNLWDGKVEVYAIGDAGALEELKRHLAEGPRSARVAAIDESDEPVDKQFNRFLIEGGW